MKQDRTILYIDDDPSFRQIVEQLLREENYNVISVNDPTRTVEHWFVTKADLILLNIDMIQTDGLAILEELRKFNGGAEIITLTDRITVTTVLESIRGGAAACVFKPRTDPEPLLMALQSAFDRLNLWDDLIDEVKQRTEAQIPGAEAH